MNASRILYDGTDAVFYLDEDARYPTAVLVKLLKEETDDAVRLHQFYNEFEITHGLHIRGIRKAYAIEQIDNKPAVLFEFVEGRTIREVLKDRQPEYLEFLQWAIRITQILHEIHEYQIIHKDINPKNILLNERTGDLFLIDFGISSRINQQSQQLVIPELLEGTLAYMSPEQTGRMNRQVDYRSDFYSLGMTFYEILSGRLPFDSEDAVALVHSHIARRPRPLHELDSRIPAALSDIVARMLEKNAEDRYQSALGIRHDLLFCLDALEKTGTIPQFELGTSDNSGKFQIPQKLYGRKDDLQVLLQAFETAATGASQMVIVSGYSGVGKTALVHEIYKPVTGLRGFFVEGKFDQYQRNMPYLPFVEGFGAFIRQLMAGNQASLTYWKERFINAAGDNGPILTNLLPGLQWFLDEQQEFSSMGAVESGERFYYSLKNFIQCLAEREHPLVIFFDDMQWADAASLELLRQLVTDPGMKHILFITAHRDNEVPASHPWQITMNEISEQKPGLRHLKLKDLTLSHVNDLLSETLLTTAALSQPLTEIIYAKTGGNPYFISEFLKTLNTNRVISWSRETNRWTWNIEVIRGMDVTDNVVHFLSAEINRLTPATRELLRNASCLGNRFSERQLKEIFRLSHHDLSRMLFEAMEQGYVMPLMVEQGRFAGSQHREEISITYKFSHDHVQQAVYSGLSTEEKAAAHYRIGNYLAAHPDLASDIFQEVDHLNHSRHLIVQEAERLRLAKLNYEAGLRAKSNSAHDAALTYFKNSHALLGDAGWDVDFDLTFHSYLEAAEEEYINGNETQADDLLGITLGRARETFQKVLVLEKKADLEVYRGNLSVALMESVKALRLLGISVPVKSLQKRIGILRELLAANRKLKHHLTGMIAGLPSVKAEKEIMVGRIIFNMFRFTYYIDQELFIYLALYFVNYSLKHGNSFASPIGYVSLGIVNAGFFQKYHQAAELSEAAMKLNEKYYNGNVKGRILITDAGGLHHWLYPMQGSLEKLSAAYKYFMESGDLPYAVEVVHVLMDIQLASGKPLHSIRNDAEAYRDLVEKRSDENQRRNNQIHRHTIETLMAEALDETAEAQYEEEIIGRVKGDFLLGYFYTYQARLWLLMGNYGKSIDRTAAAMKRQRSFAASIMQHQALFYRGMALAAGFDQATTGRAAMLRELRKGLSQFDKWKAVNAANFSACAQLLRAEIARITADREVTGYYLSAAQQAADSRLVNLQALALERLGLYLNGIGVPDAAEIYLRRAMDCYIRWGATVKVNQLKKNFPVLQKEISAFPALAETDQTMVSGTHSGEVLDLLSIVKASTAISSEVKIERLLDRLMSVLLESAGAQRGFVILPGEKKFLFKESQEADASILKDAALLTPDKHPESLLGFVLRTGETVVLDDAAAENAFSADEYLQSHSVRSVLCTPITSKGKLIAAILLENNMMAGAFGKSRITFLKILSGQIAISIENSQVYENLEQKVMARTAEITQQKAIIEQEKQKSDSLLQNILPEETAEELKLKGWAQPRRYRQVTVMFTDFVNFTLVSEQLSAEALITEINFYYSAFDRIIEKWGLEKIKTIGDSYMCAGGLPTENETHAVDVVRAALEIQEMIRNNPYGSQPGSGLKITCRIGIHSGSVVAGIVGIRKFAYDIWGDTVNIASRLETSCEPGKINISGATFGLIRHEFDCTHRGKIQAKNKGEIDMYFVDGLKQTAGNPDHAGASQFILDFLKGHLPSNLTYHTIGHVLDVAEAAQRIARAEGITDDASLSLIQTAVLFHDAGFVEIYRGHEEVSCRMAREHLPRFGFGEQAIGVICGMIMATKLPQTPRNKMEQIIADADLDYLGRDDFYTIGNTLFEEFKVYGIVQDETEWNRLQLSFLKSHHYHTRYCLTHRNPGKMQRLAEIEERVTMGK